VEPAEDDDLVDAVDEAAATLMKFRSVDIVSPARR